MPVAARRSLLSQQQKSVPLSFNRAGVAYNEFGETVIANNPRFQSMAGKRGVLIEEATTNLLTANQSNAGSDGTTTGFIPVAGKNNTISSTTEQFKQGSRSIKCVTGGETTYEGFATSGSPNITTGLTYTAGVWVLAPLNALMELRLYSPDVNILIPFTGTGNWQFISGVHTLTSATRIDMWVRTRTSAQAITYYVDMLQLEAKAYPTSWVLGGTTRNAETLTIPSSVLNIDTNGTVNLLTANQSDGTDSLGNITGFSVYKSGTTLTSSTEQAYAGTKSLKVVVDGTQSGQGVTETSAIVSIVGITYALSTRVYAPNGLSMTLRLQDGSSNIISTTPFTGTGAWQYVTVTGVATTTGILMTICPTGSTAQTFYVDQLQLEPRTSATPWILGGTQRNTSAGTIEMEYYVNNNLSSATHIFLEHANSADEGLNQIMMVWSSTTNAWKGQMTNNGKTIVTVLYSPVSNGWHKFAIKWDNTEFKFFIDGISVGTPINNPLLPSVNETFRIGYGQSTYADSLIRNVSVSKVKRTDTDITNRANATTYPIDNQVTAFALLESNLKGVAKV